jgi:signal transduction histidine kinase
LAIAGVATAAVVLFAVPLAVILGGANRTNELLRLQRDAFAATRGIDVSADPADPLELPHVAAATLGVYDRSGRLIAGHGPPAAPPVAQEAMRAARPADQGGGGPLVIAVPLVSGERVTGVVRAERPEGEAAGDTTEQRWAIVALGLVTILIAVLAALWLGRRLARPLERLASDADRLGHGDFTVHPPRAGIREVDEVGEALRSTAQRLEQLIRRERAFSADASHQLRTPMQALRLQLEAAQLRGDESPETDEALHQVDRLESTITTLLEVARDVPRRHATTDVSCVIDAARERWTGTLAAQSRPLRSPSADGPLVADADQRVVEQVLDILLDNATRHGGGAVTITGRALDGWVAIDIGDEGDGFAREDPDVFTRRDPNADGHGIGLSLAQTLAHAEGGRLNLTRTRPAPVITLFLRTAPGRTEMRGAGSAAGR